MQLSWRERAILVAPNFTVTPSAIIDVRPWFAFYTPSNGWRWLGTTGVNSSSWYRWSATPTGVATWMTPAGALNPWTWAPLPVRPGQQTYAITAFEVIYWYAHPRYVWAYAPCIWALHGRHLLRVSVGRTALDPADLQVAPSGVNPRKMEVGLVGIWHQLRTRLLFGEL